MLVCVYLPNLPNCKIQDLRNTHVVLSPCLYLSSFFFQLLRILCHYHLFLQSIPNIYTSLEKAILYYIVEAKFCWNFLFCSLKYLASPFHHQIFSICFLKIVHQFIYFYLFIYFFVVVVVVILHHLQPDLCNC